MTDFILIAIIFITILLVSSNNPINKIISLIGLLLMISIIFFIFDFKYISLSYLIIYIGAITILFLFVIMITDLKGTKVNGSNYILIIPIILLTVFLSIEDSLINIYNYIEIDWFNLKNWNDLWHIFVYLYLQNPEILIILAIYLLLILVGIYQFLLPENTNN